MPKNKDISDHGKPFSPNLIKAIDIIALVNGCDFINTRNTNYLQNNEHPSKVVNHDAEIYLAKDVHACAAFDLHKDSETVEQAVLVTITYKTYNRAVISLPKPASSFPIPEHLTTHANFGKRGSWETISLAMKQIMEWAYDDKILYRT